MSGIEMETGVLVKEIGTMLLGVFWIVVWKLVWTEEGLWKLVWTEEGLWKFVWTEDGLWKLVGTEEEVRKDVWIGARGIWTGTEAGGRKVVVKEGCWCCWEIW